MKKKILTVVDDANNDPNQRPLFCNKPTFCCSTSDQFSIRAIT